MAEMGLNGLALHEPQHSDIRMHRNAQMVGTFEVTDVSQEEIRVRSPTSTLGDEDFMSKNDAAAMAAAYRARIALAAASPASNAAPNVQPRATPAARLLTFVNSPQPTPTVHGSDHNSLQSLERKWRALYGSFKSNSQAAADVLMRQAQATSQLEELAQALFMQLKASTEDRARLQQLLLQERAHLMAQVEEAQQLQQRLLTSEHRSTAVQVVTETLQTQMTQAREALEVSNRERQQLADEVKQLADQLAVTTECRARGDALIAEQTTVIETLRQQLEEQASTMSSLAEDKVQLESQLQGVLRAEQELTVHLRETHAAIEGQLAALRDQLKAERQKRAAVVKRRGDLQVQVEQLQAQVAAQQAEMAVLMDKLVRGGISHPASFRAAPVAAAGNLVTSSVPKPVAQPGTHARPASTTGTAHTTHSRGTVGTSLQSSTVSMAAQQRSRSTLRSSSLGQTNPRVTSPSPTTSGRGATRPATQRRTSSPTAGPGSEEGAEPGNGAAVTFHVPSTLPSPEASFALTPPANVAPGSGELNSPAKANGDDSSAPLASAAHTTIRVAAVIEPPSPPIALMSARENMGRHIEPAMVGANRRRSTSPEASRISANATHHARRVSSTASRPASGRTTSPGPASGSNTWLP